MEKIVKKNNPDESKKFSVDLTELLENYGKIKKLPTLD